MQERAGHANPAAAARAERSFIRSRSRRRVFLFALALFGVVFTLLSYRLAVGLDPSSSSSAQNTVAATNTPVTTDDDDDEHEADDESDDDDWVDLDGSSSGSASSPAPSTRAS